jgi:hypothetical protein
MTGIASDNQAVDFFYPERLPMFTECPLTCGNAACGNAQACTDDPNGIFAAHGTDCNDVFTQLSNAIDRDPCTYAKYDGFHRSIRGATPVGPLVKICPTTCGICNYADRNRLRCKDDPFHVLALIGWTCPTAFAYLGNDCTQGLSRIRDAWRAPNQMHAFELGITQGDIAPTFSRVNCGPSTGSIFCRIAEPCELSVCSYTATGIQATFGGQHFSVILDGRHVANFTDRKNGEYSVVVPSQWQQVGEHSIAINSAGSLITFCNNDRVPDCGAPDSNPLQLFVDPIECMSTDVNSEATPNGLDCICKEGFANEGGDSCVLCPWPNVVKSQRTSSSCLPCPAGRTSAPGAATCDLCPPGRYTYKNSMPLGGCTLCSDLELPIQLTIEREQVRSMLSNGSVCSGGVPGAQAVVAPLPGVWVHVHEGEVELLGCQSRHACVGVTNITVWLAGASRLSDTKHSVQDYLAANCGGEYTGFLCGQCVDGFMKLDGSCVPCSEFGWGMLVLVRK